MARVDCSLSGETVIRSLYPWSKLTRSGVIPPMKVCRLPIFTQGVEIAVGEVIAPETFASPLRLRQFYERRRIEPVTPPPNTKQAARERLSRRPPDLVGEALARDLSVASDADFPSPNTRQAARDNATGSSTAAEARRELDRYSLSVPPPLTSVVDLLGGVDVPVVEEDFPDDMPKTKSNKGGYAPRRQGART